MAPRAVTSECDRSTGVAGAMWFLLASALAAPTFTADGLLLVRDGPNATLWDPAGNGTLLAGGPRRRIRGDRELHVRWARPRGVHRDCRSDRRVLRADPQHRLVLDEEAGELVLESFRGESCRTRDLSGWTLPVDAVVDWADWSGDRAVVSVGGQAWFLSPDGRPRVVEGSTDAPGLLSPTDDLVFLPDIDRVLDASDRTSRRLVFGSGYGSEAARWGAIQVFRVRGPQVWNWETGELLLALPWSSLVRLDPDRAVAWAVPDDQPHQVTPWTLRSGRAGETVTLCRPGEKVDQLVVPSAGRVVAVCEEEGSFRVVSQSGDHPVQEHASTFDTDLFAFDLEVSGDGRVAAVGMGAPGPKKDFLWLVDLERNEDKAVRSLAGAPSLHGLDAGRLVVSGQSRRQLFLVEGMELHATPTVLPAWDCLQTPEGAWICDRGEWLAPDGTEIDQPVEGKVLAASQGALLLMVRDGLGYRYEVRERQAPYELLGTPFE